MLDIIIQLDISLKLTHQVTTIICRHKKKKSIIKKKYKIYAGLNQNSYVKKIHRWLVINSDFIIINFDFIILKLFYRYYCIING